MHYQHERGQLSWLSDSVTQFWCREASNQQRAHRLNVPLTLRRKHNRQSVWARYLITDKETHGQGAGPSHENTPKGKCPEFQEKEKHAQQETVIHRLAFTANLIKLLLKRSRQTVHVQHVRHMEMWFIIHLSVMRQHPESIRLIWDKLIDVSALKTSRGGGSCRRAQSLKHKIMRL